MRKGREARSKEDDFDDSHEIEKKMLSVRSTEYGPSYYG